MRGVRRVAGILLPPGNSLHGDKEIFPDIICFHSQQSAEKYLKAYLVFLDQDFPKTHALEDLVLLGSRKRSGMQKTLHYCK